MPSSVMMCMILSSSRRVGGVSSRARAEVWCGMPCGETKRQFSPDEHDQKPQSARCDAGFVELRNSAPETLANVMTAHQLVLAKDDIGMGRAAVGPVRLPPSRTSLCGCGLETWCALIGRFRVSFVPQPTGSWRRRESQTQNERLAITTPASWGLVSQVPKPCLQSELASLSRVGFSRETGAAAKLGFALQRLHEWAGCGSRHPQIFLRCGPD